MSATVTYLQFQIQICFVADRAFVSPSNVQALAENSFLRVIFSHVIVNFHLWPWPSNLT